MGEPGREGTVVVGAVELGHDLGLSCLDEMCVGAILDEHAFVWIGECEWVDGAAERSARGSLRRGA